jgi:cyanophycin synthetase
MMEKGITTGPQSAQYVLRDPTCQFAVLNCKGRHIAVDFGFSICDISVYNIQERPFRNKASTLWKI